MGPSQEKRIREMGTPIEDLKAVFAREKERIGKDYPILVPESYYDTAVRVAKDNNILVKIEPIKAVCGKQTRNENNRRTTRTH